MQCQVLVDWLTFSVKERDPARVIRDYLGLDPALFQDAGYGLLGYGKVLRFSDICVCYEPRENDFFRDMGVCVSMSGNGCRTFETMSGPTSGADGTAFLELFRLLASDAQANISRLDIACWVRVELVMRQKNASAFVAQLLDAPSVGRLAAQVINDKFSFIDRDDSNITRCTVCSWWLKFVDELESVRLVARCAIQHSVERVENWVESQVGPSLAILLQTLGWPHVFEIAHAAIGRLSEKQQCLISDYNALKTARMQAAG